MTPTDRSDTRNYDFFKTAVIAVLALVIIILLVQANETPPAAALLPASLPTATDAPTPPPAATDTPTPPPVALPVIDPPHLAEDGALTLSGAGQPIAVPKLGPLRLGQDGALTLAGTAEPGATLEVLANGVKLGAATAGADGAWTFDGQLAPGDYRLIVRTLDAGGVVVNESRPAAVQVLAPPVTFELPNEAPASGGQWTVSGAGQPGSLVTLLIDGEQVGEAMVDADGMWRVIVDLPPAGEHTIAAQMIDADGRVLSIAEATAFTIEPALPAFDVAVVEGAITVRGTSEPRADIAVVVDGDVLGITQADAGGNWLFSGALAAGSYRVAVRALTTNGAATNLTEAVAVQVEGGAVEEAGAADGSSATVGQSAPAGQTYIVQDDDWLSKIALLFFGDAAAYSRIIAATNLKAAEDPSFSAVANPDAIEVGWKLWIPSASWNP
ncbi:MAG TPA: Ig-like domain-containing protein [Anaerolineae bacterium]|nr:Ig-like domain-containing protein [Anaerolineae bacterium]